MARTEPSRTVTTSLVVWITGDQDLANVRELSAAFAQAAALGGVDLVVDLSGVAFMDASTVGAIVRLRHLRALQCAPFAVWAPSAPARGVLSACGLLELLEGGPEHGSRPANALVSGTRDRARTS